MYSFSLISLYFAVSTTYASPLPLTNSAISSWTPPQHHLGKQNTVVAVMPQSRVHFEPSLDSIGIEISKSASSKTIEDAEAERFWLPVGERVYVRKSLMLLRRLQLPSSWLKLNRRQSLSANTSILGACFRHHPRDGHVDPRKGDVCHLSSHDCSRKTSSQDNPCT